MRHWGLIKMATGLKKMKRSQINDLARQLGHVPSDVIEISIKANCITVTRLIYTRDGNVSMGVFGPNTSESYHYVDEDVVEDVAEPTADGAGA